jgi:OOP family OmpA-OmpF porin
MKNQKSNLNEVRRIAAVLCAFAFIALVATVPARTQPNTANPQAAGSKYQFKVGVLPFVDNTASGGEDLGSALSRAVQAEFTHSTDIEGRVVKLDQGTAATDVDAQKAVAIGRAQGVDVIIVGTVLEANSERSSKGGSGPSFGGFSLGGSANSMKATVTLQADIYDVTTGKKLDSIRVTGTDSQTKVGSDVYTGIGSMSTGGASFDNAPIGKALHKAVADLTKRVAAEEPQMTPYTGGGSAAAMSGSAAASSQPGGSGSSASASMSAGGGQPTSSASAGAATTSSAGGGQPDLKTTKIEFIPGEKTIFFEDFSDMVPDEPPPHWKVRDGTVDLRVGGNIRELYAEKDVHLTSPSFVIPTNFTFQLQWTGEGQMVWHFQAKDGHDVLTALVRGEPDGQTANVSVDANGSSLGSGGTQADNSKPVEFALWAQQGRVRAYINGQRLVDVNQVEFGTMDHIYVDFAGYRPNGMRQVRVAESAPDFSTVINSTGKYITHGINFDTDSDRLKPESSAVLKQVAAGLMKNPSLNLEIDGYTDSVGDAAHNLDLSKRRALAVQNVLVTQFGIDAGRLSSNGFGPAKPIGSNDTPDGRAANRRVEFLKK